MKKRCTESFVTPLEQPPSVLSPNFQISKVSVHLRAGSNFGPEAIKSPVPPINRDPRRERDKWLTISELYLCLNRTCHFEQVSPADHSGVVEAPPNTRPSLSNIHIWRYSENSIEMNELEQRRKNFLQCFGFSGESMKTRLENAPTVGSLLLAMVGPAPYSCPSPTGNVPRITLL